MNRKYLYRRIAMTQPQIVQWQNRKMWCWQHLNWRGSTLYSKGLFVRRFFRPKPFEVAMLRRTCGPKVLNSEVHLLRRLLCSWDSIFRKDLNHIDSMLRRFISPKFLQSEEGYVPKIPYSENHLPTIPVLYYEGSLVRSSSSSKVAMLRRFYFPNIIIIIIYFQKAEYCMQSP